MKKIVLSLLGATLLMSCSLFAQQTSYRLLHDGAPSPKLNLNLEFFTIDLGTSNIDGGSFNLGATGFFQPVSNLGVQWNVKRSLWTFGALSHEDAAANLDISAGGYFFLNSKEVKKPTKVTLKTEYKGSEYSRNVSGDLVEKRTEEVTFMMVPANRTISNGVRAGYYMKRGPFANDNLESEGFDQPLNYFSLTSMGAYVGLTRRSLKNVFVDVDGYGVQYNSIGDDFALDLLIVPVNIFRDLDADKENVSPIVRDQLGGIPLGFRIGWYRYQIEKRTRTGKRFGMSTSIEAGIKPYQGIFFNGGIGLTIIKR